MMKLGGFVDDVGNAWKWFSVQGLAFLTVAPVVYENAGFLQDFVPAQVFHWMMGALGAMTLASRLIKQPGPTDPEATAPGVK